MSLVLTYKEEEITFNNQTPPSPEVKLTSRCCRPSSGATALSPCKNSGSDRGTAQGPAALAVTLLLWKVGARSIGLQPSYLAVDTEGCELLPTQYPRAALGQGLKDRR